MTHRDTPSNNIFVIIPFSENPLYIIPLCGYENTVFSTLDGLKWALTVYENECIVAYPPGHGGPRGSTHFAYHNTHLSRFEQIFGDNIKRIDMQEAFNYAVYTNMVHVVRFILKRCYGKISSPSSTPKGLLVTTISPPVRINGNHILYLGEMGYIDMFIMLLDAKNDILRDFDTNDTMYVTTLVQKGRDREAKLLLQHNFSANVTAFVQACKSGLELVVSYLIKKGFRGSMANYEPLREAIRFKHNEIVFMLLNAEKVNVVSMFNKCMDWALTYGNEALIDHLNTYCIWGGQKRKYMVLKWVYGIEKRDKDVSMPIKSCKKPIDQRLEAMLGRITLPKKRENENRNKRRKTGQPLAKGSTSIGTKTIDLTKSTETLDKTPDVKDALLGLVMLGAEGLPRA